jgi:hypothetical protein
MTGGQLSCDVKRAVARCTSLVTGLALVAWSNLRSFFVKNCRLFLAALLLVAGREASRANIGETEVQCIARYGDESNVRDDLAFDVIGDKAASFQLKSPSFVLSLDVIFFNGVDAHETVRNADTSQALSEEQKNEVLDLERAGLKWERQKTTFGTDRSDVTYGSETWIRSDGAVARCWMSRRVKSQSQWTEVDFSTRDYAAAQTTLDRQNGAN